MIAVSDTSSLNALHKIGQIALPPALFRQVLVPERVRDEMLRDPFMRNWLENFPDWLTVSRQRVYIDPTVSACIIRQNKE